MQPYAVLDHRLLNEFQRDFPLQREPFAVIARQLGTSPADVIERLQALQDDGTVSRVGPVFRPNTIGASTLAAMAVPPERLSAVAAAVNGFSEVNHNYEREHRYNLWFVVAAPDLDALEQTLEQIESRCGYPVISLPLERDYHIDLGFNISAANCATRAHDRQVAPPLQAPPPPVDTRLVAAIQKGLPLVTRPFDLVGAITGQHESAVRARISALLQGGIIKRFGVVVRHHELGYRANAMAVWDVPGTRVDALGNGLAALPWVTLCYRRRRHRPEWGYNLYCMIHGREHAAVRQRIASIIEQHGMADYAHAVLFSRRRFKQRGALYHRETTSSEAMRGHA